MHRTEWEHPANHPAIVRPESPAAVKLDTGSQRPRPSQLMPRADHIITAIECHALSDYWEAQAQRDDVNPETILVALAEAKHWRDVADTIEFLLRVTPFEYPDSNDPRFKRKRR